VCGGGRLPCRRRTVTAAAVVFGFAADLDGVRSRVRDAPRFVSLILHRLTKHELARRWLLVARWTSRAPLVSNGKRMDCTSASAAAAAAAAASSSSAAPTTTEHHHRRLQSYRFVNDNQCTRIFSILRPQVTTTGVNDVFTNTSVPNVRPRYVCSCTRGLLGSNDYSVMIFNYQHVKN
jgi:hypothetical protein